MRKPDRNEPSMAEKMKQSRRWTWMILLIIVVVYFFLYRGFYGNGQGDGAATGEPRQTITELPVGEEEKPAETAAEKKEPEKSAETAAEKKELEKPAETAAEKKEPEKPAETTVGEETSAETAAEEEGPEETVEVPGVWYEFRNRDRFISHFEKHGDETGHATAEEYLAAANAVINDPAALHKNEAEDGDDIYFREETGEIVFVSTQGYIRTYFIATRSYFDRQ